MWILGFCARSGVERSPLLIGRLLSTTACLIRLNNPVHVQPRTRHEMSIHVGKYCGASNAIVNEGSWPAYAACTASFQRHCRLHAICQSGTRLCRYTRYSKV
jgi:hypothetical protein